MWVSTRAAGEILTTVGVGREEARRLLQAGLAGEGLRMKGALLYEEQRVRALAAWPVFEEAPLEPLSAQVGAVGVFIGRVSRTRRIDVTKGREELVRAARDGWRLSTLDTILIRTRVERFGSMPFVLTLCGYVVLGADVVGIGPGTGNASDPGRTAFELADPGAWFDPIAGYRLRAGARRAWFIPGWSREYAE